VTPTLLAYLRGEPGASVAEAGSDEPATSRCSARLTARFGELARRVKAQLVVVDGHPVMTDVGGHPFAFAWGDHGLALRAAGPVGAILYGSGAHDLPTPWVAVDPWPQDVTFRRGVELLVEALHAAHVGAQT
jgi:hypothetical protein